MPRVEERAGVTESRTFLIRRATDSDAPGILETLRAAFEDYRDRYTREAFLDTVLTLETVGQRLSDMSLFVAIDETGEIVGTVGCNIVNGEEGHIRGMAVRPKWQGAGVATHLLNSVESAFRDMKCTRISLNTTEPLQRAMQLYEKNGFCRSGKVSDFFGMNLFEYVKVLKVEDPPDRAESQPSHETHL